MTLNMKKTYNEQNSKWLLEITGDIDIASSKEFKEMLISTFEEKAENITLDFTQLDYIDSTGLGIIIGAYIRMKDQGKELSITNPKESIKKLLNITKLDKIFMK